MINWHAVPALIIAGGSVYSCDYDYAKFHKIVNDNGTLLMMEMAHISGLIATNKHASPFELFSPTPPCKQGQSHTSLCYACDRICELWTCGHKLQTSGALR